MQDKAIVDLYWSRSENAIEETSKKYGNLCRSVAYNILRSTEDSEECVNDTYLKAWNAMPNDRPEKLGAYLGVMTRNLAIDRYRKSTAKSRPANHMILALDELAECIPDENSAGNVVDTMYLGEVLNRFLGSLSVTGRAVFIYRYWMVYSVAEIARMTGMNEKRVSASLMRSRAKLKSLLEKEEIL